MMIRALTLAPIAAAALLAAPAVAADAPLPVRTIMQTFVDANAPNTQVAIAKADFAPGAKLPFHTHPGEESGVVVSGLLMVEIEGKPTLMLKPGDSYLIPRGVAHQPSAPQGATQVIATFVTDKAAPLSTPSAPKP